MKKKFFTLITVILTLAMSVFAFAGCGGGKPAAPNAGFDIQLAKQVALELDVEVEFV